MLKKLALSVVLGSALLLTPAVFAQHRGGGGNSAGGHSFSGSGSRGFSASAYRGGGGNYGGRGYYGGDRDHFRGGGYYGRGYYGGPRFSVGFGYGYGGYGYGYGYGYAPYYGGYYPGYSSGYYVAPAPVVSCDPPGYYDRAGNYHYNPGCYVAPY